ncbi:MAG: hypothetical protein MI975_05410 [Cytophagales bacterium]|nr:hypothetical protein [Cytophagales bacterium]
MSFQEIKSLVWKAKFSMFLPVAGIFLMLGFKSALNTREKDSKLAALMQAAEYIRQKSTDEKLDEAILDLRKLRSSEHASFAELQRKVMLAHPAFANDLLFVTRKQYQKDHHNTATLFQKGEINDFKFEGGAALKWINLRTGKAEAIFSTNEGVVRDPEVSYDGLEVLLSYRKNPDDDYHIYKASFDKKELIQLTFDQGISDIDPIYLPDGDILFSSTREPKYCMCNRHIMSNLYRMESDGSNIVQLSKNTLFDGHPAVLSDGRIIYDRWEYVDRNFGDAQGLWTANPDGTNHAIFYGNNMNSPGGVIDPRPIPGTSYIACIFGSCHDRPWGALTILDRSKGVDGEKSVVSIWPSRARKMIGVGNWDKFMELDVRYEDPFPLDDAFILCSRTIERGKPIKEKMGIFLVDRFGNEVLIHEEEESCFDPMLISPRTREPVVPVRTTFDDSPGYFYVQNVYEGTHMEGVKPGSVKYLRVVETPEKRTFTPDAWGGQGQQAPGMNWHNFELKRILGEAEVERDGSVYVEVPSGKFVYFQLLDENKKMIQSMRSGTMVQSGEVRGCIGCHEDRLSVPLNQKNQPMAMRKAPVSFAKPGNKPENFGFAKLVQPVFDNHCIKCHDFGAENESGLILAGDRNPYFNASYIDLHVKSMIRPIGGGPARIQPALSWGANASKLVEVIESAHHDVNLSQNEKEILYTWIDLNAIYYPSYESAYPNNPAGRSPLTEEELKELGELTGTDFKVLKTHLRTVGPQISFERPEVSPCLQHLNRDSRSYKRALQLIYSGKQRLSETPRADMEGFRPDDVQKVQIEKYLMRLEKEKKFRTAIAQGEKAYDLEE